MKIKSQMKVTEKMINKYHEKCNSTLKVTVLEGIKIYKEAKWNKNQKKFQKERNVF